MKILSSRWFVACLVILLSCGAIYLGTRSQNTPAFTDGTLTVEEIETPLDSNGNAGVHPLTIEALKNGSYPGSEITIEEKLSPGSNYQRYLTSYRSEGLKIYALLTIPNGETPENGWPAIVFNHGYIPPQQYRTTERYIAYTDAFSRNGYILFRPDYRGHGNSEGQASGGYGSTGYTVDVLNAFASLKKLPDPTANGTSDTIVDISKMGMWGHSMGGVHYFTFDGG